MENFPWVTHGQIFLLMCEFVTVGIAFDILWIILVLFCFKMSKKSDDGGGSGGESDNDGFELYRIGALPENYGMLLTCYYDATNMLLITEITKA